MDEYVTSKENFLSQYPSFWDVVKTIMNNAMFLQVCNPVTQEAGGSIESLRSLATEHLPIESHVFSLLPVAPGGRSKTLDRYLLLWCSMSDPGCPSLPPHVSSQAIKTLVRVAFPAGFGCFMRDMGKIEREQLVAHCTELMERNPTETTDQRLRQIILEGIQAIFGRPSAEAQPETITSSSASLLENAESSSANHHTKDSNVKNDFDAEGKGKDRAEIEADPVSGSQQPRDPRDAKPIFGIQLDVGGDGMTYEETRAMIESVCIAKNRKVVFPTIELVSPAPDDPAVPKLRPVTVHNPQPEDYEEPKKISPLEYTTSIGDASVVHKIYLDSKTTGIPRTAEQELGRRQRAAEMVFEEMMAVAQEARRRRDRRYSQEGPLPSVIEGAEHVSAEERRKWLSEKLAKGKEWMSDCQATIRDTPEASDHITVVFNALCECKHAGAEGIIF